MSTPYEFSPVENELFGNLAKKMSLVGLVTIVVGVVNVVGSLATIAFMFQDSLPPEARAQIPAGIKVPDMRFLWGIAIQEAVIGLIFLLIGAWTRKAAGSFHEIVATSGRDMSHLMKALMALYAKYSLMYSLIVITILATILSIGLQLYLRYAS